jgi:hypothetical protein
MCFGLGSSDGNNKRLLIRTFYKHIKGLLPLTAPQLQVASERCIMKVLFLLPFLAAAQAAVVPAVDTTAHFHSTVLSAVGPQGKNVTINGVLTYVTLPKKKFDPTTAVLLLTDVFGLPSPDNLLLVSIVLMINVLRLIPTP